MTKLVDAQKLLSDFNEDMAASSMNFAVVIRKQDDNSWEAHSTFISGYSVDGTNWAEKAVEMKTMDDDPNNALATIMLTFMNTFRDPSFIQELYLDAKAKSTNQTTS